MTMIQEFIQDMVNLSGLSSWAEQTHTAYLLKYEKVKTYTGYENDTSWIKFNQDWKAAEAAMTVTTKIEEFFYSNTSEAGSGTFVLNMLYYSGMYNTIRFFQAPELRTWACEVHTRILQRWGRSQSFYRKAISIQQRQSAQQTERAWEISEKFGNVLLKLFHSKKRLEATTYTLAACCGLYCLLRWII